MPTFMAQAQAQAQGLAGLGLSNSPGTKWAITYRKQSITRVGRKGIAHRPSAGKQQKKQGVNAAAQRAFSLVLKYECTQAFGIFCNAGAHLLDSSSLRF